jgi:hypothetical protein
MQNYCVEANHSRLGKTQAAGIVLLLPGLRIIAQAQVVLAAQDTGQD